MKILSKIFFGAVLSITIMGFAGSALATDGASIFKAKCSACHGADGTGAAMGPAFQGSDYIKAASNEELAEVTLKGRNGADKNYKNFALGMPAQKLNDDEMKALVSYLKSLGGK